MRVFRHYLLAPLVVAAAFFALGASAEAGAPATHSHSALADPVCPAGTNWDNILHMCR